MKKVLVVGKTDVTINLNKIGVPIRGRTQAVLSVSTEEHMNELSGLTKAGLIDILSIESDSPAKVDTQIESLPAVVPVVPVVPVVTLKEDKPPETTPDIKTDDIQTTDAKKRGGRPKGSKNKAKNSQNTIKTSSLAEEERKRTSEAEAKTQKMRSRVVIGTLDGPKQGHMAHSAIDDLPESEKTQASIEAMDKLEKEEKEDMILPDTKTDESKLDASEQNGRKAVISTQSGVEKVDMVNSILPESDAIRKANPFIDNKEKSNEPIEDNKEDDDFSDAFIKI